MENPNENPILKRHEIHEQLTLLIPELRRRACTERVMAAADFLIDQMLELDLNKVGEIADGLILPPTEAPGGRWSEMGTY